MNKRVIIDIFAEAVPTTTLKERAYVGLLLLAVDDAFWVDVTGRVIAYPDWVLEFVEKVSQMRRKADIMGVLERFAETSAAVSNDEYDPPRNCTYLTGRGLLESLGSPGPHLSFTRRDGASTTVHRAR
jgi:hypothetical protein